MSIELVFDRVYTSDIALTNLPVNSTFSRRFQRIRLRSCLRIRDFLKIIAKMAMSLIRYDACQRYWRFETSVLVCDVFSASVLTAPVCSARMCVYLETRQGKIVCTVYKVSLFCSVLWHFGQISLFLAISVIGLWLNFVSTGSGLTFRDWLIMPSKCPSAKVALIKPIDLHLYLISDWNSIIKITFL